MWPRIGSALLGIWLMASPDILGYADPARTNDRIVGPVAASFAVIAIWEATRSLRWLNLALGIWLAVAPWLLGYQTTPLINSTIVGISLVSLALIRGSLKHRFGGGWSSLWRPPESGDNRESSG